MEKQRAHSEYITTSTRQQRVAANILFYLDTLSILDKRLKSYTKTSDDKKNAYSHLRAGLIDLFFIHEQQDVEKKLQFMKHWGNEGQLLESFLNQTSAKIQGKKEYYHERASSFSSFTILRTAFKAGRTLTTLSASEQEQLLHFVGYERHEIEDAAKSIATSAVLNGSIALAGGTISAGVLGTEAVESFTNTSADPKMSLLVLSSFITRYALLGLNAYQNKRLLENFDISPNILSTTIYLLLKKLYPDQESLAKASVYLTSIIPPTAYDLAALGSLVLPLGPTILTVRNAVNSALTASVVGISEIMLRRKNKLHKE